MGNVAVAEELAGSDELDELCKLDASETEPDDVEDDDEEEGDEEGDEAGDEAGEGLQPEEMPHG